MLRARKWELSFHGAETVAINFKELLESYCMERKVFPVDYIHAEEIPLVGEDVKKVATLHKKDKLHKKKSKITAAPITSPAEVYGAHLKTLIERGLMNISIDILLSIR